MKKIYSDVYLPCPNDEVRLAFLHGVLAELAAEENAVTVDRLQLRNLENHLQTCQECQLWLQEAVQFDRQARSILVEPLSASAMGDFVVPVLSNLAEKKRRLGGMTIFTMVGMSSLIFMSVVVTLIMAKFFGPAHLLKQIILGFETGSDLLQVAGLYLRSVIPSLMMPLKLAMMFGLLLLTPLIYHLNLVCNRRSI
jgi:hypothetical protein